MRRLAREVSMSVKNKKDAAMMLIKEWQMKMNELEKAG